MQECDEDFLDPEREGLEEDSTCTVWFMDFDGENLTQVAH